MARQEKKTRIKGLPAKLYLQQRDARSGSYPSVVRVSSDNRTGKFPIFYDDTKTMVFSSASINLGATVPNSLLTKDQYQEFGEDISSSLVAPGSVRKGLSDIHLAFTPGQSWKPYKEIHQFAAENKKPNHSFYSTGSSIASVGEGFSSPLWSKSKIEIDLTSGVSSTFKLQSSVNQGGPSAWLGQNNCYPMCYWNDINKKWEGIGTGYSPGYFVSGTFNDPSASLDDIENTSIEFLRNFPVGFGNGTKCGIFSKLDEFLFGLNGNNPSDNLSYLKSMGAPIQDFMFPFHSKFHATSSNFVRMSDYINEPFLLEKAVLIFTGSFELNQYFGEGVNGDYSTPFYASTSSVNFYGPAQCNATTFFILNQRSVASEKFNFNPNFSDRFSNVFTSNEITKARGIGTYTLPDYHNTGSFSRKTSIRDLVTWFTVMSGQEDLSASAYYSNWLTNHNYAQQYSESIRRELNIPHLSWSGQYILSGNMKSMSFTENYSFIELFGKFLGDNPLVSVDGPNLSSLNIGYKLPGRNGLTRTSPKSFLNTYSANQPVSGNLSIFASTYENYSINNPYILTPEDNLIFGWQLPMPNQFYASYKPPQTGNVENSYVWGEGAANGGNEPPTLTLAAGPAKIILYGSKISNLKEKHDTLNQLVTSETVHEVIG